jgi:hypothetical protein
MFIPSDALSELPDDEEEAGHPVTFMLGFTLLVLVAALALTRFVRRAPPPQPAPAVVENHLELAGRQVAVRTVDRRQAPVVKLVAQVDRLGADERPKLECRWLDPAGNVAGRQAVQARQSDGQRWRVEAEQAVAPTAPVGRWRAQLRCADRVLCGLDFEVRDAPQ